MTELGGAGTFLSPEAWQRHPGAIGYPFPYIELRLVDPQGNPIDEAGHSGSIEVRGPGVAACYWGPRTSIEPLCPASSMGFPCGSTRRNSMYGKG